MPPECNNIGRLALVGYPFNGPNVIEKTDNKMLCERFFAEELSPLNFCLRQQICEQIPNVFLGTPQQIELSILYQGFKPTVIILESRVDLSDSYLRNVWDSATERERNILEFQKKSTLERMVDIWSLAKKTRANTKILIWGNGSTNNSRAVNFATAMQSTRRINYLQEQTSETLAEAMFQYCGIKN